MKDICKSHKETFHDYLKYKNIKVFVCISRLNEAIHYGIIMYPMRAIDCLIKTTVSDMENLPLRCWSKEFKRLLKQ